MMPEEKKDSVPPAGMFLPAIDQPEKEADATKSSPPPEPQQRQFLPCMEQPARCYFTCNAYDKRLSAMRDGRVLSSDKRSNVEQFVLIPQGNDLVMIQSVKHGALLRRGGTADTAEITNTILSTTKEQSDASLWCMEKAEDGVYITCMDDNTYLACDAQGNITMTQEKDQTWSVEFQTGELCFVSSPAMDRRVRCDLIGALSLSENWKGWEVWRFIEADGHGYVRISAWMHHNHYLCSNADGSVYTSTNPQEEKGTLWAVEQEPDGNGVTIRSVLSDRLLCCDNESLFTDPHGGAFGIWQLEAAHRQKYSLTSMVDDKSIGPFPSVTDKKRQMDEWEVEKHGNSFTFISTTESGKCLASTQDGKVCLIPIGTADTPESWEMEVRPDGGCAFRSTRHNRYLSWEEDAPESEATSVTVKPEGDGEQEISWRDRYRAWTEKEKGSNGTLCTVLEGDGDRVAWRLEPVLPRAVSGGKIKTFAIGTAAAVATTVAMPFAVAGVVGLIGAEVGILADIVIVGLTSAEAIASVGVVGTTAALVFKASGDSYGSNHEDSSDDTPTASFAKRPFAAIGSGKSIKKGEVL